MLSTLLAHAVTATLVLAISPAQGTITQSTDSMALVRVPNTYCLDGSTAGFYYGGPSSASTAWVIVLEGGGACFDQASCAARSLTVLGSSTNWSAVVDARDNSLLNNSTIASADPAVNPDFHNAHHVVIPYCTGDVHTGQHRHATSSTWGLHFSGHTNLVAIVADLIASFSLGNATDVLFTGTSAGGKGVFNNVDWLQGQLPSAFVAGAPVSGWFFPGHWPGQPSENPPPYYQAFLVGANFGPGRDAAGSLGFADPYAPPGCVTAMPVGESYKCQSISLLYPHIRAPLFIEEMQFDTNQLVVQLGLPTTTPLVADQLRYVRQFGLSMRQSIAQLLGSGSSQLKAMPDGVFLPSCLDHFGMGYPGSVQIDGRTSGEVMADWFWRRGTLPSHRLFGASSPLPSNPTCVNPAPCVSALVAVCGAWNTTTECTQCVNNNALMLLTGGCSTIDEMTTVCNVGATASPQTTNRQTTTIDACNTALEAACGVGLNTTDCYTCALANADALSAGGCRNAIQVQLLCDSAEDPGTSPQRPPAAIPTSSGNFNATPTVSVLLAAAVCGSFVMAVVATYRWNNRAPFAGGSETDPSTVAILIDRDACVFLDDAPVTFSKSTEI